MSANPIWIAGYFGPIAGAAPVWIAPGDGTVPSAVQSEIVSYYAPIAGATAVWIAGFFAPPPAAIGATPITISGWGGSGGGGPPPVTSVWSAADAAANGMTLSNGGLTVTPSGYAGDQSLRGSISKNSGKYYVEFLVTGSVSVSYMGLGLADTTFQASNEALGSSGVSMRIALTGAFYGTNGFSNTNNIILTPNAGDIFSMAIDFNTGKVWMAQNNTWAYGSDPAAGTGQLINIVAPALGVALFPAMSFWGPNMGVWTLQSTAASQKYAPPSGFVAWG